VPLWYFAASGLDPSFIKNFRSFHAFTTNIRLIHSVLDYYLGDTKISRFILYHSKESLTENFCSHILVVLTMLYIYPSYDHY
jgi:hypothetical protein